MAEMKFVISENKLRSLFSYIIVDHCDLIRPTLDKNPDKTIKHLSSVWEDVQNRMCQFFLKNPSFASDSFKTTITNNVHMGQIHTVSSFSGDGHITFDTFPIRGANLPAFELSIGYGSFFIRENREHISPSDALKAYYKSLVKFIKSDTRRFELIKGYSPWFEIPLLEKDSSVVEALRHRYRIAKPH
ncbi:hypothetical protein [Phyllobacterium sp. 22552]|uniref:hypothetical protein n=1 Tax=Phyllobacterium sp. 22552 TaxID=3453941 RepID=UPI003F83C768